MTDVNESSNCFYQEPYCGSTAWFVINIITTTITLSGNLLTIGAILFSKRLSSVIANQFVFSLAVSDLLVGCSVPYHMAFYVVEHFGANKLNCLLRFVLISFACSSSICNLLFIAADRYVAIVYPLHYVRLITRKSSLVMIILGWCMSFSVAVVPLMWNDWHQAPVCELIEVIPQNYMNFVVYPMFILIWVMMLLLYSRICREATGHAKRMRSAGSCQNVAILKDSKSIQVMLMILGCFTICWLPYFVIALYARYHKEAKSALLYEIAFNLAVANSGMNPLIYAWKNHNFRAAFFTLLRCRSLNAYGSAQYVTNHVPSKKNSISNEDEFRCPSVCEQLELAEYKTDGDKNSLKSNGTVVDSV
ncbi:5-hydroxytryptamine receptor 1A [Sitophilus oryzae]|uniref:5-hydroxytryptamine receptor 1A n=1 Tax=Sitophilus oryzae TaxID=7048 RepID=A0A6J2XQE1_SITOR|nr:5-hydroxytryptamine receptor 1A [Sitophilus oryzae]